MDIKGLILRRLYIPKRLRVFCDESCSYCGDSVIIIAVLLLLAYQFYHCCKKNTSQEIVGLNLKKILLKSSSYLYILYLKSFNSL